MFVAAGPLRCASGPGDPQPFHSIASRFRLARLSERRRPAVPFTRLRPAFDLPGSRSVGGPQPPAAKARPNRRRWRGVSSVGRNSFGAVCEWGCEGSERPGLRSGSGNSESEAGSGPASPAIAGGPQPSAAKARNSLQSLPPFAGCAREPPLPSASRDPAPSTCLPSNGPVHFPPENRLSHPPPENRLADPPPENHPVHLSPETPRRPPASRATVPFISRPRTASPISARAPSLPAARSPASREPLPLDRRTVFFHESWKPIPACAPYLCGVRPRRASPSFRKTKLGAAAAGSSTADRRTKLLPSAFPAARIESAAPGRDFPETHVSDRSARRSRGRVAGLAGPGHGDVRALGGAAQETAPFDRPRSPALSRK